MNHLQYFFKYITKAVWIIICVFTFACGNAETGSNNGNENRENAEVEKSTEGGQSHSRADNEDENPNGTLTADSLNTDSSTIRVDNNQ